MPQHATPCPPLVTAFPTATQALPAPRRVCNRLGSLSGALLVFALSLVCLCGSAATVTVPGYRVTDLGVIPGGDYSIALGINRWGQVTGFGSVTKGGGPVHAFLYSDGRMRDLGILPGTTGSAGYAINSHGDVAGTADDSAGVMHAVLFHDGGVRDLGALPGGQNSIAFGINNHGQITGYSDAADGEPHAFLYQHGKMQDLNGLFGSGDTSSYGSAINQQGDITGGGGKESEQDAFLYRDGSLINLGNLANDPGGFSTGTAINERDQITGYSTPKTGGGAHALLYQDGVMIDLGTLPGGFNSYGLAMNRGGDVVGWSEVNGPSVSMHAFLYRHGRMRDLNNLVPASAGWVLLKAVGINNCGQIAGDGLLNGNIRSFLLTPPRCEEQHDNDRDD